MEGPVRFYIRDLLKAVASSGIGYCVAGTFINILAYADDIVLIPLVVWLSEIAWYSRRSVHTIGMSFNTKKTVCMIFNPCDKRKIVCSDFPQFVLAKCNLTFVSQFKYLGHIIEHSFSDYSDISRELKSLFARTNLLIRRFARCTSNVKAKLFWSFVLCFMTLHCGITFSWPALKSLLLIMLKALNFFRISQTQQCHCDVNAITSAKL